MSPFSKVLAQYLVDQGVGTAPGGAGPFFVYYAKEPNDDLDPDNVITVYGGGTKYDMGRMRGGDWYGHPEVNFRIRSIDENGGDAYDIGESKGREVLEALSRINNTPVIVPGDATTYWIVCYTVGQGLVFMKEEDPPKKRQVFTINGGHITIRTGG